MQLVVYWVDMRGGPESSNRSVTDVVDKDSGKCVGWVEATRSPIKRHISLFDGKYQGHFTSHQECDAFAEGVQAVLNHLTATEEQTESKAA